MADTKPSAFAAATLPLDGTESVPLIDAGVPSKVTVADLFGIKKALASDATANSTTTAAKITGLDTVVDVGIWTFQYFILYQSSIITTGVKFSVNHSGTLTVFVASMRYTDALATASSGAPKGNQNATTAGVTGSYTSRVKSAAANMGPTLSVDTANADMLMIIEGLMVVTVSGTIQLYHASETAASTQVMTGTSLILNKTG